MKIVILCSGRGMCLHEETDTNQGVRGNYTGGWDIGVLRPRLEWVGLSVCQARMREQRWA